MQKRGVLDRDPPRKPDSRTCERKALSERDSCVCILKMCAEAIHKRMGQSARGLRSRSKILPRSAQILIVMGKAFAMHVNARSSNHDPNHVLNRDPKCLSERDSSPCEHSQCGWHWGAVMAQWLRPWTLYHEVSSSKLLAAAVVPLGEALYPHSLRKDLKPLVHWLLAYKQLAVLIGQVK